MGLNNLDNGIPKEIPSSFQHDVDYEGDTNEKTHDSGDSPSETDGCVRNLAKEHKNEQDK